MDHIKFIIEDFAIVLSVLMMVYLWIRTSKFHQGNSYKLADFLIYFKAFYRKHYYYLLLIPFIFVLNLWYMQLIYIFYLIAIYFLSRPRHEITKLAYTGRIWRLGAFMIIFYTVLGTLLMLWIPFKHLTSLLAIYVALMPGLTYLGFALMTPVELLINKGYHLAAKAKLKKHQPLIIGITGSSGKTSVKNYIYDILKTTRVTFMSPKSYNTLNGISRTINEYLHVNNATLVLEMGATKLGDIEELVKFTGVDIAIVTQITSQHMRSFLSVDNIINEKMKIVEGVRDNGFAILNYDCPEIRSYQLKNPCRVISIGTTPDCDYYASDINMSLDGISFTCVMANEAIEVKTKLVGRYNINNILIAIALAKELQISNNIIKDAIYNFEPVKHRLEIKKDHLITTIDDAYNANPLGFKMALEVLSLADNKKTIITPGIVDAGIASEAINYDIALEIAKVCDEVILIDNPSSRIIHQGLVNTGFTNIRVVNNFKSAQLLVTEGTVLIANDLPDNYFI